MLDYYGGGVIVSSGGSLTIVSSSFVNNITLQAVMAESCLHPVVFTNNTAAVEGGVIFSHYTVYILTITSSDFNSNTAALSGAVMYTSHGSFITMHSIFTNNTCTVTQWGGVTYTSQGSFKINPRRMCERVIVVCLSVCPSVYLSVCPGSSDFISDIYGELS